MLAAWEFKLNGEGALICNLHKTNQVQSQLWHISV